MKIDRSNNRSEGGFVALVSVLIISLLLIAITFTISYTGFAARFTLMETEFKHKSEGLAEACIDQARLKLVADSSYAGGETIEIGNDSCDILSVNLSGSIYTIQSESIYGEAHTSLTATVDADDFSIITFFEN